MIRVYEDINLEIFGGISGIFFLRFLEFFRIFVDFFWDFFSVWDFLRILGFFFGFFIFDFCDFFSDCGIFFFIFGIFFGIFGIFSDFSDFHECVRRFVELRTPWAFGLTIEHNRMESSTLSAYRCVCMFVLDGGEATDQQICCWPLEWTTWT